MALPTIPIYFFYPRLEMEPITCVWWACVRHLGTELLTLQPLIFLSYRVTWLSLVFVPSPLSPPGVAGLRGHWVRLISTSTSTFSSFRLTELCWRLSYLRCRSSSPSRSMEWKSDDGNVTLLSDMEVGVYVIAPLISPGSGSSWEAHGQERPG